MAIDIRANVTCSLGDIISGSIGDDYIQGNGLIKTSGQVEVNGLITPNIGTSVTFSYEKEGITREIPRRLRVLSSFADPFRRTTKVEIGCKLTYLSDLRESIDWEALDDPNNSDKTETDTRIVTLPIYASSVMNQCLDKLGLTASSNPLTNKFSIGSFDFSSGYVSVLSDLLTSESYFGYLDYNEVLQVISLDNTSNLGPVYTVTDLIDIGAINSGNLPGESVVVSYNTLKLKPPESGEGGGATDPESDEVKMRLWELAKSVTGPCYYQIGNRQWSGMEVTRVLTTFARIGDSDVPVRRVTEEAACTAKIAGSIGTAFSSEKAAAAGRQFNASYGVIKKEVETQFYSNGKNVEIVTELYEDRVGVFGGLSLAYVDENRGYVNVYYGLIESGKTIVTNDESEDLRGGITYTRTQQVTSNYKLWPFTVQGQQAIAEYRGELDTAAKVAVFLVRVEGLGLTHDQTSVSINTNASKEVRPKDVLNASLNKGGDPNNGWRTEGKEELQLALGSATAQRRIELSMPYAPDDSFFQLPNGSYSVIPGDASTKAILYGRIQNKLLLGNRNGMSMQLAPEKIPASPFSPVYVEANGLTAYYRTNGNQWAFSKDGIVCSTDALFWGAVGGTGTFWFPVAPGITTLPETPPIIDGEIDPSTVVLPYNETVVCRIVSKTKVDAEKFEYSFLPEALSITVPIKSKISASLGMIADDITYALEPESASIVSTRILTGLKSDFIIASQNIDFIPRKINAETGSFAISGQYDVVLRGPAGIVSGIKLPVLGASSAADITEDTTGWVEHTTNSQWWNGSSYVSPESMEDTAYLSFDSQKLYFASVAGIGEERFPNDCFILNHPYMMFNGFTASWTDDMFVTDSYPPFPRVFFGAESEPGISLEKMTRRVLWREENIAPQEGLFESGKTALRIRYEGTRETSGTPGVPDIVAEISFLEESASVLLGYYMVEVRIGITDRLQGLLAVTDENGPLTSSTITQNNSWVFKRLRSGSSWTVFSGYHYS